jgi:hypothetical protein
MSESARRQDTLFVSFENLLALDFFSPFPSDPNRARPPSDGDEVFQHLRVVADLLAPNRTSTTLLLTVRRQPEWFASLYSQYSNRIVPAGQSNFTKQVRQILNTPSRRFLDFGWVVRKFGEHVGVGSVNIVPLEEFGHPRFEEVIRRLVPLNSTFVSDSKSSRSKNVRRTAEQRWQIQKLDFRGPGKTMSPALQHLLPWALIPRPNSFALTPDFSSEIMEHYKGHNANLTESWFPLGLPDDYS